MPRRGARLVLAAAALVAAGVASVLASVVLGDDRVLRAAPSDRPVNTGAQNLGDIAGHTSPTIARNPRDAANLAVSSRIDGPRFSCALHVSDDGGTSWRRTRVPIPAGEQRKCYAPDVGFAADGTLHLAYVTLRGAGNVPHALWVARSRDGGRTLEPPVRVSGPRAFQVRLAADPGDPRRLYATWLQAAEVGPLRFTTSGNPVVVARSDDAGQTWRRPVPVSAPGRARVLAPTPAVGPGGVLYVLFLDVGDDRLDYHGGHDGLGGPPYAGRHSLVLARSRTGGTRWEESVVDDRLVPIERFVAFLPAFPALAVDRASGRVFAGYHDARHGSPDVLVWALDRGAARWRGPSRIGGGDAARDRTVQRLPQLAVGEGGRLDVVFYDHRPGRPPRADAALRSSSDAGRSFGPPVRLSSRAFDPRIGFGSERGMPDRGSRLGLVSTAGAVAVWSDTRNGTDASHKQNIYLRHVVAEGTTAVGRALRDGGIALVAGGLAGLAIAALRGASRRRRLRV